MDLYQHIAIYQTIADLENTGVDYIIYARYFFLGQQMNTFEPVYINQNSIKEVRLMEESLWCRMMLDSDGRGDFFSVVIPFNSIRKIVRVDQHSIQTKETLYWQSDFIG